MRGKDDELAQINYISSKKETTFLWGTCSGYPINKDTNTRTLYIGSRRFLYHSDFCQILIIFAPLWHFLHMRKRTKKKEASDKQIPKSIRLKERKKKK